jgi:hypothetical protein
MSGAARQSGRIIRDQDFGPAAFFAFAARVGSQLSIPLDGFLEIIQALK